ncbi:MAG: polyphosphate kinase 1 [Coriobacteriales bacterium]|nr:polyphosphate kinase 1 [Coriobacteriales bacterium]
MKKSSETKETKETKKPTQGVKKTTKGTKKSSLSKAQSKAQALSKAQGKAQTQGKAQAQNKTQGKAQSKAQVQGKAQKQDKARDKAKQKVQNKPQAVPSFVIDELELLPQQDTFNESAKSFEPFKPVELETHATHETHKTHETHETQPAPAEPTKPDTQELQTTPAAPEQLKEKQLVRCMQNRELSWLRFNERVLEEASSLETPLFERLFFLSVYTSNLDEFFMVRVGGFHNIAATQASFIDSKTGLNAQELLNKVFKAVSYLYPNRDSAYAKIEAELARAGSPRRQPSELSEEEEALLHSYYQAAIAPLLAPQVVDKTHPFPHLENKRLIVALRLEKEGEKTFGMIPLPTDAERLYFLDNGGYILLEDILLHYADKLFKKYTILERAVVCVTRNADMDTIGEQFEGDDDFREHMSKLLKHQKRLAPVRLEIQGSELKKLPNYLKKKLKLEDNQVFMSVAPLDLSYQGALRDHVSPAVRKRFSYEPFEPIIPPTAVSPGGMFKHLRQGDVMLFHPFESIQPLLSLVKEASEDPKVVSIQVTLYRLASRSRLAEYLIAAAENGKHVVVFIELRARMDERHNIDWAKRFEEAGCSVFYGQLGYKTHAKILLITRRESDKTEHFVHIGTGNYNERTAKAYTDISLLTANEAIAADAVAFFQNMQIGAVEESYDTLLVAPQDFKPKLIDFIRREGQRGSEGLITIKCNSLTDSDVIAELVKASRAGTRIDLILRGICCLLPGVKGLTENIHIRSIVGRYLEHTRIYRFGAGEDCDLYIGSGDMMTRNTTRRVEMFAPVLDPNLRARIFGLLDISLHDCVKARSLMSNGQYISPPSYGDAINSQQFFINEAQKEANKAAEATTAMAITQEQNTGFMNKLFSLVRGLFGGKKD